MRLASGYSCVLRVCMFIHIVLQLHPKWNENEKSQKCTCMSNVLGFLSQPERSLTPQLDTIDTEESLVKPLRLRGSPQRLYRAKHLPA